MNKFYWYIGTKNFIGIKVLDDIPDILELTRELQEEIKPWVWDKTTKEKWYDYLAINNLIPDTAKFKDKEANTITSTLVYLKLMTKNRELTNDGISLIGENKADVYLKNLETISFGSVKPMIILEKVMDKLGYLAYTEFTYLVPLIVKEEYLEEVTSDIFKLRDKSTDLDSCIYKYLLKNTLYQDALNKFLKEEVTEELIIDISLSEKMKILDKPYYPLYQKLKDVYINKSNDKDIKKYTKKILSLSGKYWDKIFDSKENEFSKINNEEELKKVFFKYLHVFKIKANMYMHFDLNRRFINLTDIYRFNDKKLIIEKKEVIL